MAITVPTLQSQATLQGLPSVRSQPLQNTVGESIAEGLDNVSNVAFKIQREEKLKADRTAFMEADRATDDISNGLLNTAKQTQLKDAIGITPEVVSAFDKQTAGIASGLKNKDQQRAYQESMNQHRSQLQRELNAHESQQTNAYYTKSREDYKDQQHVNAVTDYKNPKTIEDSIAKVGSAVDQTPGMDAQQKTDELGIRRSGIYAGVISRYLANDELTGAEQYYASIKDRVNGDAATKIENDIRITRRRLETEHKANLTDLRETLREQMNDVHAALLDGRPIASTDLPDQTKLKVAFGERGVHYIQQMNQAASMSSEVQQLHDKTNEELKNELVSDAATKTAGSVEGAADEAALRGFKRQIITNLVQQREKDPAVYITSTSPVASQALQDVGNEVPGSAERYFRAVDTERRRLGITSTDIMPPNVKPGGAEWQKIALLAAKNYTTLPKESIAWADAGLRSNDPAVASQAARFVANAENLSHDAAAKVGADERTTATQLNRLLDAGSSVDSAMATIKESREVKPEIREGRAKLYGKNYLPQNASRLNSFVDEFDPGLLSPQPSVPPEMQADFNNKVQTYFVDRGDIDVARKRAWDDLKRVYSPSRVNGSYQMMLLPPERFGVTAEEVRKEIASLVNGSTITVDQAMKDTKRTELSPAQENDYRAWLDKIGMTREKGFNLDQSYTGNDYDLRGFFKKYGAADVNVAGGQHFTDEFKLPNHQTFSNQSAYATGAAAELAGTWNGDTYVPPQKHVAHPQPDGSKAEDIVLVPSSKTVRQVEAIMNGEQITPSYRLITKSGDEFTVDGRRQEYTLPDLKAVIQKRQAEQAAAQQQLIDEARFKRQTTREIEALHRAGHGVPR